VVYRYTNGVERFPSIIHFDFRDILSNTNEVEVGLVQRLYLKHAHSDCKEQESTSAGSKQDSSAAGCAPAGLTNYLPGK